MVQERNRRRGITGIGEEGETGEGKRSRGPQKKHMLEKLLIEERYGYKAIKQNPELLEPSKSTSRKDGDRDKDIDRDRERERGKDRSIYGGGNRERNGDKDEEILDKEDPMLKMKHGYYTRIVLVLYST